MRYLPTDADILDACYWRLSGVSAEQVQAEMETGSPLAATAVDTAINALPMAISPAKKGVMAARERMAGKSTVEEVARIEPTIAEPTPRGFIPEAEPALREGFTPLTEAVHEGAATTHKTILVDSPETLRHQAADQATAALPKAASVDEAVAMFETAAERPVAPPSKIAVDVPVELQPGRFSGKAFGDDLLESLKHEASPELLEEISREQQRRGVLAESLANDHAGQAMQSGEATQARCFDGSEECAVEVGRAGGEGGSESGTVKKRAGS